MLHKYNYIFYNKGLSFNMFQCRRIIAAVVSALLAAGAHYGHSLKEAALMGHVAVVRVLLDHGMAPGVRFGPGSHSIPQ
jgi:hypothetical protein